MNNIRRFALSTGVAAAAVSAMLMPATAFAQVQLLSDTLTVTFDGVPLTRTLPEAPGESVTSDLSFIVQANSSDFRPGQDNADVFLIQPPGTNGQGIESDKISFKVDGANGLTVHFTMQSDEDPGRSNIVTGVVETGLLQNITKDLFPSGSQIGTTGFYLVHGHSIQVLAQSDVEPIPEPETYALMLAGLATLGFVARRRKGRHPA